MNAPLGMSIAKAIPFALGLFFLYFFIGEVYENIDFLTSSVKTTGTIVYYSEQSSRSSNQTSKSFYTVALFIDDKGEENYVYSKGASSFIISSIGDEVEVRYIKGNSDKAHLSGYYVDMWGVSLIFGLFALVLCYFGGFLVLGMLYPIYEKYESKHYKKLVQAKIKEVFLDKSIFYMNRSPYIIEALWVDPRTAKEYLFYSYEIWGDLSDVVKAGDYIKVKVNPKNYDKYLMDVDLIKRKLAKLSKKTKTNLNTNNKEYDSTKRRPM